MVKCCSNHHRRFSKYMIHVFCKSSKFSKNQKIVDSNTHDACITWRAGNGTILLQNVVRRAEECTKSRIDFWSSFIDMYYRGSGSTVNCCQTEGCNDGSGNFRDRNYKNNNQNRIKFQLSGIEDNLDLQTTGKLLIPFKT